MLDTAADNRVDVDVKLSVLGQYLKFSIQHLEALFRDLVGHDVVDRDLHVVEPGTVEPFDPIGGKQVTVSDQAGKRAALVHRCNDIVEVRMKKRFAAAESDNAGAEIS